MVWLAAAVVVVVSWGPALGCSMDGVGDGGAGAPVSLRCEYLVGPVGIDARSPRLSWVVNDARRGAAQTAYRVVVSSGASAPALWDTGKVVSGENSVEYAGPALGSGREYAWKVMTWDAVDRASEFSAPARFAMGLLEPGDWKAEWVGLPTTGTAAVAANNGYHSELSDDAGAVKQVTIDLGEVMAVDGVKLWPAHPAGWKGDAAGFLFPARFKIEVSESEGFAGEGVHAVVEEADRANPGDEPMERGFPEVRGRYVRLTATRLAARTPPDKDRFGLALAEMQVLRGVEVVSQGKAVSATDSVEDHGWSKGHLTDGVVVSRKGERAVRGPSPMLRKGFRVGGRVKRAVLYATARGLYQCRVNGRRVGQGELAPEWTDYVKRIQYQAYDVTPLVREGENVIAAVLADGWYAGKIGLFTNETYGRDLSLLAQLHLEMEDGSEQVVVTDGSWRGTVEGPWRRTDILDGVEFDARRGAPGWDATGFDDAGWVPVSVFEAPAAALVAQRNEPVRVTGTVRPVALKQPRPGVWVFDMGQNMPGWIRLVASGPAGGRVSVQYAEATNADGTVYTANLRGAAQRDTFILAGRASEVLEPAFTYHGFRYAQVTGLGTEPTLASVEGRVVHSDLARAGEFECSEPMLNKLMSNIVWTQLANMQSTPTDCPQRDERLGWMGDAQVFAQAACFNRDMASFFSKWLADVRDAQGTEGAYPDFAPNPVAAKGRFMSVPAWGDAGVIVPWRVYQNYADVRVLRDHFESARRWVEYIRERNPELVWRNARGNNYNDWLNADTLKLEDWPSKGGEIPHDVFATAFFEHSTRLVSRMARAIGRADDAAKYARLADDIRAVFQEKFCKPDGTVEGDTQAGYALALNFELLPESLRPAAVEKLVAAIHRYNDHVATGFISTVPMMEELVRAGHADLAYTLLLNRTIPSWGYMIDQGATTVWERWDGYVEGRPGGGFQDAGMNSFSHYAIGSVGEWMYRHILGINPDDEHPGFGRFEVRPLVQGPLTWARGSLRTIRGDIRVDWAMSEGRLRLALTVPPGSTALVVVPTADPGGVTAGGVPVMGGRVEGVRVVGAEKSPPGLAVEVASGTYEFEGAAPGTP